MPRKNIFEILKNNFDIPREMNKLVGLFSLQIIFYTETSMYYQSDTHRITIEMLCDTVILPKWKQRGNYLSHEEIKRVIPFPENFTSQTSLDTIVSCLEYYCNLLYLLLKKFDLTHQNKYKYDAKMIKIIYENINNLLDHLHYEKKINEEEETVILIPKNPAATAVAEITENKDIAFAILKYNHASLKGDLEGKKQLLLSIANEYEPLLKSPIDGFTDYFKKATFLLNNLNLRHNNKSGQDKKQLVVDMPNKELEKWYDELYQLLLFCVLIKDNVKRKKEIDDLVKKIN
ncbi:hypothetical protein [Candidatus Proelusimicrobium excrementi]|uniref:hypothetical protein n=1 Tax=Candidatus Proelusimicrobium excrementi TaxID=3416222 RepID=UPI003CB0DBDC|nr:hypothetical protein [Elusimicrobiaceae bacterium]